MEQIYKAMTIAANAHKGQERWGGTPYIIHPFRIAMTLLKMGYGSIYIIAALLHDVVEDTSIDLPEIYERFGTQVGNAVDALTKRFGEDYFDYVRRCMADPFAKVVKKADLQDNIRSADGQRNSLTSKYEKSLEMINE